MTRWRRSLVTFPGPTAGLRLPWCLGAAAGREVNYPCYQGVFKCESHCQLEGFQTEGGPTLYPHTALSATGPTLISRMQTVGMSPEVQKRCLQPKVVAGSESLNA
jgi:hypothetical protein